MGKKVEKWEAERNSLAERLREISEADPCGYGVRYYNPKARDRSWNIHRAFAGSWDWDWDDPFGDAFAKAKQECDILKIKCPHLVVEIFTLLQGNGWEKEKV